MNTIALTFRDLWQFCYENRETVSPDSVVYFSTGTPGEELLLLPLAQCGIASVHKSPNGGAWCQREGDTTTAGEPAAVLTLGAGMAGAWGFRPKENPARLYLVRAVDGNQFTEAARAEGVVFACDPIPFRSWLDFTLYLARDESDNALPEVTTVNVMRSPFARIGPSTAGATFYVIGATATARIFSIREQFGDFLFGEK